MPVHDNIGAGSRSESHAEEGQREREQGCSPMGLRPQDPVTAVREPTGDVGQARGALPLEKQTSAAADAGLRSVIWTGANLHARRTRESLRCEERKRHLEMAH